MVGEALRSREAAGGRFFHQSSLESRCVCGRLERKADKRKQSRTKTKNYWFEAKIIFGGGNNRTKICQKERRKIALDLERLE